MRILVAAVAVVVLSTVSAVGGTVGFQRAAVPDSDNKPRQVGIWYPSEAPASSQPLGPYNQTVAIDGEVACRQLPLDTALALVEAGFVVAGISQSQDMRLPERPRHVGSVLSFMLGAWRAHDRRDPSRIGIFGFSVGGFTALISRWHTGPEPHSILLRRASRSSLWDVARHLRPHLDLGP